MPGMGLSWGHARSPHRPRRHAAPLPVRGASFFPLPNLVLFPDVRAPQGLRGAATWRWSRMPRTTTAWSATALLRPGWEQDYAGNPPIHETVCVGKTSATGGWRAASTTRCSTGSSAPGSWGARGTPYRRARVEVIEDVAEPVHAEALAKRVRRALDLVPGKRSMIHEMRRMANQLRGVDAAPGRRMPTPSPGTPATSIRRHATNCSPSDVMRRLERLIQLLEQRAYSNAPSIPPGTRPHLN